MCFCLHRFTAACCNLLQPSTRWAKLAKAGKRFPLKADDKEAIEALQKALAEAVASKEAAKTTEQKLAAALALDEARAAVKKVGAHLLH